MKLCYLILVESAIIADNNLRRTPKKRLMEWWMIHIKRTPNYFQKTRLGHKILTYLRRFLAIFILFCVQIIFFKRQLKIKQKNSSAKMATDTTFPEGDAEAELNPGQNTNFEVDPVSSEIDSDKVFIFYGFFKCVQDRITFDLFDTVWIL